MSENRLTLLLAPLLSLPGLIYSNGEQEKEMNESPECDSSFLMTITAKL